MKRITFMVIALITMSVGLMVYAGNSGVSDATITLKNNTPEGLLRTRTLASLKSLETAVNATIAVADAGSMETGVATNTEVVAFSQTYTSAPIVMIQSDNATNVSFASSITTTNFVANMKAATTNTYIVLAVQ
jgi:hypothetical protein